MRSHLRLLTTSSFILMTLFMMSCKDEESLSPDDGLLSNRDSHNFTYSINPAQVGDSVEITFDLENGADCGLVLIQVSGPDGEGWSNGGKPVAPESGLVTHLFVPDAPGEYRVRGKYTRTGNPNVCDFESTGWIESADLLLVEGDTTGMDTTGMEDDTSSCEVSFTGEAISCDSTREVVFTYTSDEDLNYVKIKGGLTNGTLEDATVVVEGADLDVTQKTPGNSSNRVITLEGSVEACVTITITITWNSSNEDPIITGDWTATGGLEVEGLECE